jgi:hypothetical protein
MVNPSSENTQYRLIGPSEDGLVDDLLTGKSDKEGRLRLQALLAEWLRMENVVVLTGAGTSVSCGGKTMETLETSVIETLKAMSSLPANLNGILDERGIPVRPGRAGFEDWLSYLANAAHIISAADSPLNGLIWKCAAAPSADDLKWLVATIGKSIFTECALTLPDPMGNVGTGGPGPHIAFLSKLIARDSNLGRVGLFTLNYDTLFEQALELLGIQYFDGFTGRANARFDPSVYGLDVYYPGEVAEGRVRRFDKFLQMYKLHGSIHWQEHDGEMRARHPDLSKFADYRALSPSDKAVKIVDVTSAIPSAGVLPTANKFAQTLMMPYSHLFRSFQIKLTSPQTFLLILGYGFGDDHVTRVIETALMNPSLIMLVVEPNPGAKTVERVRRYKDLGKRAFVLIPTDEAFKANPYRHATFDDFALSILPDVQWLHDFLRLRRFERQIYASDSGEPSGAL